jgi:serine/threonine protein kinase
LTEQLELILPFRSGGERQTLEVDFDDHQVADEHFRYRYGRTRLGEHVVQRLVHTGGDGEGMRLLQREVSIGRRLYGGLGRRGYPEQLTRLIGHNVDDATPYSLFTDQPGSLAELDDRLPLGPEIWRRIARQLLMAMRCLQYVQIVHRRIRPETVRWDGIRLQLADLTHAVPENRPREAYGVSPWDPPEQLRGEGSADICDDVYSFGMLMVRLMTGADLPDDASVLRQLEWQDVSDRRFLRGTRDPNARQRPTPDELFRRLPPGEDSVNPLLRKNLGAERSARTSFALLRERQREHGGIRPRPRLLLPTPERPEPAPPPTPPPASTPAPDPAPAPSAAAGTPRPRPVVAEPMSRPPGPGERDLAERGSAEYLRPPRATSTGAARPRPSRPVPPAVPIPGKPNAGSSRGPWWVERYRLVLLVLGVVMATGLLIIALGAV